MYMAHIWGLVLEAKNILIMVPAKYSDHTNVFSPDCTKATQVYQYQQWSYWIDR